MSIGPFYLNFFSGLSVALFLVGLFGVFLHRRNILILLMSIELMLLSINMLFIFSRIKIDDIVGQVMSLYVLTVAAGESAIGLALLVSFFNIRGSINMQYINRIAG